jgi:hypothetical protein
VPAGAASGARASSETSRAARVGTALAGFDSIISPPLYDALAVKAGWDRLSAILSAERQFRENANPRRTVGHA